MLAKFLKSCYKRKVCPHRDRYPISYRAVGGDTCDDLVPVEETIKT